MKTLKIKTLDRGWHDKDELMLHAIMQLVVDFIEKERPDEYIDWDSDEGHRNAWNTLTDVYDWWTVRRNQRHNPVDDLEFRDDWITFGEPDENGNVPATLNNTPEETEIILAGARLESEWYHEDTEMMQRIVSVREYMWT